MTGISGFAQIFINLFYLIGILVLLIIIIFLIGVSKDAIRALFIKGEMSRIQSKLIKIERHANEILRDFRRGASFVGLAKTQQLGDELDELNKLCKKMEKGNKKKKA